jgi:hypothetical protein
MVLSITGLRLYPKVIIVQYGVSTAPMKVAGCVRRSRVRTVDSAGLQDDVNGADLAKTSDSDWDGFGWVAKKGG